MQYVYIKIESGIWTVGFYDHNGDFRPESGYCLKKEAAERVHWLNGVN